MEKKYLEIKILGVVFIGYVIFVVGVCVLFGANYVNFVGFFVWGNLIKFDFLFGFWDN